MATAEQAFCSALLWPALLRRARTEGNRWTQAGLPSPRSMPETAHHFCSRGCMALFETTGWLHDIGTGNPKRCRAEQVATAAMISAISAAGSQTAFLAGSALPAFRDGRTCTCPPVGAHCCWLPAGSIGSDTLENEWHRMQSPTLWLVLLPHAVLGRVGAVRALEKDVASLKAAARAILRVATPFHCSLQRRNRECHKLRGY